MKLICLLLVTAMLVPQMVYANNLESRIWKIESCQFKGLKPQSYDFFDGQSDWTDVIFGLKESETSGRSLETTFVNTKESSNITLNWSVNAAVYRWPSQVREECSWSSLTRSILSLNSFSCKSYTNYSTGIDNFETYSEISFILHTSASTKATLSLRENRRSWNSNSERYDYTVNCVISAKDRP